MKTVQVLILAGQRQGVVDPLLVQAGITYKALLPIINRPMIDYVLEALDKSAGLQRPYWISGITKERVARDLRQAPSADGPASSVVLAAETGLRPPFLVTTCDHALLEAPMIEDFLRGSLESEADFTVALARKEIIQPAYPDVKRTYLKFKDVHVSGCNLFYVANAEGLAAIRFWQQAQNDRKHPLKLARRLGFGMLLRYITGQLTLDAAFRYASKTLAIKAKPVMLERAEAAIDVDKPSDLELVTEILRARV